MVGIPLLTQIIIHDITSYFTLKIHHLKKTLNFPACVTAGAIARDQIPDRRTVCEFEIQGFKIVTH